MGTYRVLWHPRSATTSGAIGHRYGDDAESLAQTSLAAVQSAAHTALNVVSLGPKAVAKSSAASDVYKRQVLYVGPWGQAALRLRYVHNAGGWYA